LVVEGVAKVEAMVEEVVMVEVEGLGEVVAVVHCWHLYTEPTAAQLG
jgi:hypothetical protein